MTNTLPPSTELTPKGQMIYMNIFEQAKQQSDMGTILVALAKAPKDAEFIEVEVSGKATALRFEASGWTPIKDNRYDGGVYRPWVRLTTLRASRAQVEALAEREVGI